MDQPLLWRVEMQRGRRRPWWATVEQGDEASCRAALDRVRVAQPHRRFRLLNPAGTETEPNPETDLETWARWHHRGTLHRVLLAQLLTSQAAACGTRPPSALYGWMMPEKGEASPRRCLRCQRSGR